MSTWTALLPLSLVLAACAPGQASDTLTEGEVAGELRRFELADYEHPEAGKLTIYREDATFTCTATLIGPRTIITAAHCFDFESGVYADKRARFTMQPADRSAGRYIDIHRTRTLGTKLQVGADVAIAQLDFAVPASLAQPAPVAAEWPDGDDDMTVFGYGSYGSSCENHGDGHKRKWTTSVGGTLRALTCPGDSGGPFFHAKSGSVIAVVKGDFWGAEWVWSAVRHFDWIEESLAQSEAGELSID